nr:hypothetical protein [Tanacetum cinerariifolium]
MANLSKDIQCAGSTRPPMLDRTDFASWQQRIRLYCRGKDNGVNILKSIDEGSYILGTFRETLAESTEGTPQFGLPKDIYTLINHYTDAKDIWDNVKMLLEGSELTKKERESQLYDEFEHSDNIRKCQLMTTTSEWGRFVTAVKLNRGLRESNYDQLFAYPKQHEAHAKENKMVLERLAQPIAQPTTDPLALLSNVSNAQHGLPSSSLSHLLLHLAKDYDAFDSDIDEAPTAQTMFMANLSSANPITDEARPSYDLDILSEVRDHDQYLDDNCAYQEEHVMHDIVQLDHIVDLHADHTSISNIIPYDQYVKDIDVSVVHNNASSVPNDTFMMIYDDMCESITPSVSNSSRNALRLVISDRNFKEEALKWELHSTKLQITSTINSNKSMVEETTFLKQDFKQKENKILADFLNMKSLKEKVEDRLVKQDQSLQTVYMLCRPRPLYNDLNKVAIGYKNPLCLTRAKQAQPALYNGHEILKDNHARAKAHNSEDTLEIAKLTRKKMNAKMTDPECVTHKVKIAPHDYSKENLLATFTPQKQLTPKQIYWSNDLMKLKSKALKERAKVSKPIKAFTVYPPNTLATLVPRVLLTTSQVKIHIFTLIQQFLEFDKTCKKRITPSAITDGERGFEQTKACYLQEVIPFFQTIKENFEGIQKALTREVKQMKDVFEEFKAKVQPPALTRTKHAVDVEPIVPRLRNNREAHLDYLRHLKESVETIYDIVEEAKV